MPAACLLLLLCPSSVSCGRSSSSLQGDRGFRLDEENNPPPRYTARKPKADPGKLTSVIDVSDDLDQQPDSEGEYTGASLTKPGMPPDFIICSAFMTEAWTTTFRSADLFAIQGKNGKPWGNINYFNFAFTMYQVNFGVVVCSHIDRERVYLGFSWTRVCVSLDRVTVNAVLVANGEVLEPEKKVEREDFEEEDNRPTDLIIQLGYRGKHYEYQYEFAGHYSNTNIFSSPLSTEMMIAMTQAGNEECGAPGDFLSWEEADWQLTSRASKVIVGEPEGPCRIESKIDVFTADFKWHGNYTATNEDLTSGCMEHCQKIGKGRSPPVRTLQELETLQTELQAITPDLKELHWL